MRQRTDAPFLLAAVADGAGSARLSQIGARLTCRTVCEELSEFLSADRLDALEPAFVRGLLGRLRLRIGRAARRLNTQPRDLACTLLVAVVGPGCAVFFQIGDGAIVFAPRTDLGATYELAFWPQRGEYANETVFATDPRAESALDFRIVHGAIEEVALFSDGLQNLVLDQAARRAHARFFGPMFSAVRHARPGHSPGLSNALARFLGSADVRRRTDDDASLILATRRVPEPAAALPSRRRSTETTPHGQDVR